MMALNERIEQELVENVTLERVEKDKDGSASKSESAATADVPESQAETPEPAEVEQRELVTESDSNNEADFERLVEISSEWPEDNVGFGGSSPSQNQIADSMDRQHDAMANMTARPRVSCRQRTPSRASAEHNAGDPCCGRPP